MRGYPKLGWPLGTTFDIVLYSSSQASGNRVGGVQEVCFQVHFPVTDFHCYFSPPVSVSFLSLIGWMLMRKSVGISEQMTCTQDTLEKTIELEKKKKRNYFLFFHFDFISQDSRVRGNKSPGFEANRHDSKSRCKRNLTMLVHK